MLDYPKEAVGYDETCDFFLEFPLSNDVYFVTNFIGKGQSGYVFNFQKLNKNENNKFELSNFVIKVLN